MTRLIFFIPLIFMIIGCNHSVTRQRIDDCKSKKIVFLDSIVPFDKHNIKKTSILIYLPKETVVDTEIVETVSIPIYYLKFKCDSSNVVFVSVLARGTDFKIENFDLKSNMFLFKNKIKIGMIRSEFFKIMNINDCQRDTFDIDLNMKDCYLNCFFSKDTLRRIRTVKFVEP